MSPKRWPLPVVVSLWIVLILLSFTVDLPIALFADRHGIPDFLRSTGIAFLLKAPGEFAVPLFTAVAVTLRRRPIEWRQGLFILAAGLASGANGLVKWLVGRARPFRMLDSGMPVEAHPFEFHPMPGGLHGLLAMPNLTFPSGHATLAFATAAALSRLFPQGRWIFYGIATLTAIERFLETAHYLSDTVMAAALGISVVHLVAYLWPDFFQLPAEADSSTLAAAPLG